MYLNHLNKVLGLAFGYSAFDAEFTRIIHLGFANNTVDDFNQVVLSP